MHFYQYGVSASGKWWSFGNEPFSGYWFLSFRAKVQVGPLANLTLIGSYNFFEYFNNALKNFICTYMNISISKDIEPLSEFRKKSAEFVKRLKKEKQPIVLTQHGKSAAVLIDVTEFERISKKMEMLEDLLEAKQQVEQGKTFTMQEAKDRVEKHLSKWK